MFSSTMPGDFNAGGREATRVYTPSLDSDDDLHHISSLDINDKSYRLFSFRKDGRSWVNALCTESNLSETDIKARVKRSKKAKHGVDHQLEKMSVPRKNAVYDLLDRVRRRDTGEDWDIVAIENDKPELTKRTGEVVGFSVILAKIESNRQNAKPKSQERRRSNSFMSPNQEFALPGRRGSKTYSSPTRDKTNRASQTLRGSQPILEDDPFGNASLFSPQGKPIDLQGGASYPISGLPPHIPLDEPIGAKPPKQQQKSNLKSDKKSKKGNDDDNFDLEALLGPTPGLADLLGDPLGNNTSMHHDHHNHFSDSDSLIEVEPEGHDYKPRGRKRNDSGFESKTPKRPGSDHKSKSKPRRPSVHIPKDSKYPVQPIEIFPNEHSKYASRPIEVLPHDKYGSRQPEVISNGRRRPQSYYGSKHGSEGPISVHSYSDQSVLEAEYEDYSSSGSSRGGHEHQPEYRGGYTQADGRYQRTRDHRRGPPSPQHARYESEIPKAYSTATPTSRRPRSERFVSDGAIQPYHAPYTASRPTVISQHSTPRFQPSTTYGSVLATPVYNHDSGLVPYPAELRRRETIQGNDAELYIQSAVHQDREIELLQRERDMARSERDLARRESEMHQEVARRASITASAKTRVPKYTHEPRLSRRYTDAYYA